MAAVFDAGRQEFEEISVARYGRDGTGKGQLAEKLLKPPRDLTAIKRDRRICACLSSDSSGVTRIRQTKWPLPSGSRFDGTVMRSTSKVVPPSWISVATTAMR